MNRRLLLSFLISIPFLLMGVFAYAVWFEPTVTAPAGNLNGPVWLLPLGSSDSQVGDSSVSGKASSATLDIDNSGIISGLNNPDNTLSVYQYAAGKKAIYSLATDPTSWAGYFDGKVYIKELCLTDPVTCASASSDSLWTLQTGTSNIYKGSAADLTGMVMIGSTAPMTGANVATRLSLVGNTAGPRIYLSDTKTDGTAAGNPEINFSLSNVAGNHWGVYADTTGVAATDQLRFWQGSDRVVFTKTGQVGIGTTTPQTALDLATSEPVMTFRGWPMMYTLTVTAPTGAGTVTSNIGGINCSPTCATAFASGTVVTLTANTQFGSTFLGWGGACAFRGTNLTCPLTITADTSVTASFSQPLYTLTISNTGSTAVGVVTSTPGGISCGATCIASFTGGTNVTLNAVPTNTPATGGSYIASWTGGGCSGTGSSCVVSMTGNTIVTVVFNVRVETLAATAVLATTATINGRGNAQNQATTVQFRRGTTNAACSALPTVTAASPGSLSGSITTAFSANLTGLTGGTRYYYCAVMTSSGTTYYGSVMNFRFTIIPPEG